ncbi:hypothetical protein D3C87_1767280 [compost metagenome]
MVTPIYITATTMKVSMERRLLVEILIARPVSSSTPKMAAMELPSTSQMKKLLSGANSVLAICGRMT